MKIIEVAKFQYAKFQYAAKPFLVCLISSYFHCLLPRFKGSHQELSKYIRSFQRTLGKEKLLYGS